jgi:tetratricopeptide (TPR) repeat protein
MRKYNKYLAISCLLAILSISYTAPRLEARRKSTKSKVSYTTLNIDDAFYDKAWKNFQIGSTKDKKKVISALKKVIKKAPEEFMAYYYLGIMESEQGNTARAIKYLETAVLGFPKSADIYFRIAKLYEIKKKHELAIENYRKTVSLDPNHGPALSKVGKDELENGNIEKAYQLLTKAYELEPDNPETMETLGAVRVEKKEFKAAIDNLQQALKFNQKNPQVHWLLAKSYEGIGDSEKAAQSYQLAKKYGRKAPEVRELIGYDLANSLYKSGRIEPAIKEFKKAIRKSDDPASGHFRLGEIYEDLGDEKNAIKSYKKAYELDKTLGRGIMRAARIYERKEDWPNAYKMYELLKRNKEFKDEAKRERESIDEMREQAKQEKLENKLRYSDTTDYGRFLALEKLHRLNKKDPDILEQLYDYYKERGYYKKAIKYYRKLKKVSAITSAEAKVTIKELNAKYKADNVQIFGNHVTFKMGKSKLILYEKSTVHFSTLEENTHPSNNDRLIEDSYMVLMSRKETKGERKYIEGLMEFYEERGRYSDALKMVSKMKRYDHYTAYEAKEKRAELKELKKKYK